MRCRCAQTLTLIALALIHSPPRQALLLPIIRHGVVLLALAWNQHRVKNIPYRPKSGGVPLRRMVDRPHPGGQLTLACARGAFDHPGDEARAYHHHVGRQLPPAALLPGAEQPLHERCCAAMQQHVGDTSAAWECLIAQDFTSLVAGYLAYLQTARGP